MPSTPRQLIDQTVRHQVYLERLKTGEARALLELLTGMERSIAGELMRTEISTLTRARLQRQISAVEEIMGDVMRGDMLEAWRGRMVELARYEAGFEARSLDKVTVRYDFDLPSDQQLRTAAFSTPLQVRGPGGGQLLEGFYRNWTDDQINRVSGAIRIGWAQGQTNAQIVRGLRDDVWQQNRRGLEAMVRTSVQHVAMQARQATWERNSDIVRAVRWVSTLDSRTTVQCQALDGQEFPIDSGPRPPAHINCRSTTAAVLDDRFAVLDEGGTRSARDPETGRSQQVPADQSYYGWLKQQPADFQDSVIGPARGQLFRSGGLSAQRFAELQLGRNFEPLTLDQMRRLEPVAFERAGL